MITSAKIENFKGFKHLELPDLSRITLLGGKNNVGKTAALEAMFLLLDRGNAGMFFRHLGWRGIGSLSPDPGSACAPLFHNYHLDSKIAISICEDHTSQTIEFEFDRTYAMKALEVDSSKLDDRILQSTTDLGAFGSYGIRLTYRPSKEADALRAFWSFRPRPDGTGASVELEPENPEAYINAAKKDAVFLGARILVPPGDDAIRFGRLDIGGKGEVALEFLKLLEPRLKSLSSVQVGNFSLIHGDIGIGRKIPVALMGEGMGRLLSLGLVIATARNGIVFIDEIENGFHHSVMAKVWEALSRAARDFNCQIMATTHSYECLQAAHEGVAKAGLADEFRYVRLDRHGEDVIAKTYSHEILGAAIEAELEVR
jgi:hypothetical protein